MAFFSNILNSSAMSQLPADVLKGVNTIILIVEAIGIIFLIYLVFLIIRHIMDIIRNHRIKKIGQRVEEIDEKLDELNSKVDRLLGRGKFNGEEISDKRKSRSQKFSQ